LPRRQRKLFKPDSHTTGAASGFSSNCPDLHTPILVIYFSFVNLLSYFLEDFAKLVARATYLCYNLLRGEKIMNQGFSKIGRTISAIDRLMKMYYEKGLADYEIGWGQQFFLELIHDNPGATPQYLAGELHVDKATVTKVIKNLLKINYVTIEEDETDKRVRHLYATPAAAPAVRQVKELHHKFYEDLTEDMAAADIEKTKACLDKMIYNLKQHVWHRMEVK